MNTYQIQKDNTRLDQVVLEHYGTLSVLEKVLEQNSHIADKVMLSTGDIVYLPEIEIKTNVSTSKALWN